jgi:hypothetical protein
MNELLSDAITFIESNNGINDKNKLAKIVSIKFSLIKDRAIYQCEDFALRFSSSSTKNLGNTIASLSKLEKYDDRPFLVCIVTPSENFLILANTTFLKKVSHSSQNLRLNNIRGSFNGSDIAREFLEIKNEPKNFERLFAIHESLGFDGNLSRLVDATRNITPTGMSFAPTTDELKVIFKAQDRAAGFVVSPEFGILKKELDSKVEKYKSEILIASLIDNVNVRGRVIEYLIVGEDEQLRLSLVDALLNKSMSIPPFQTANNIGDFVKDFKNYKTATDIKTKIMILNSNPKAYNIDKMLEFLATERSVFMFYFVGIDPLKVMGTVLISMFEVRLLDSTILLRLWAGRNSRGVTQFEGKAIQGLLNSPGNEIDLVKSRNFLQRIVDLPSTADSHEDLD